jgi:hypothetical protein
MAETQVEYLDQIVEFLGFLQSKLRGLKGIATLTYELIQNADDVKDLSGNAGGASMISFDVCDDALIVENDGVFRDVDFERMQRIAFGGKREEEDTTGAFGIGFISVYQITDSPEVFSSGRHWRLCPEKPSGKKIEQRLIPTEKTRFRLPWAFEESEVRKQLRLETIQKEHLDKFALEMERAIRLAALFVKYLQVFTLARNGETLLTLRRSNNNGVIRLDDGTEPVDWQIFSADFHQEASAMRSKLEYLIEKKKSSEVYIAVPNIPLEQSALYAILPTEMRLPLPFHISADFYTNEDRKSILLGQDYQSEWNRHAIGAAATAAAQHFDQIIDLFAPEHLWQFLSQIQKITHTEGQDAVFQKFWEKLLPFLPDKAIVQTTTSQMVIPDKARLVDTEEEKAAVPILEKVGIAVVHQDLRKHYSLLQEVGVQRLRLDDIIKALQAKNIAYGTALSQAPKGLQSIEDWEQLWAATNVLFGPQRASQQDRTEAVEKFSTLAIAFDTHENLCFPEKLYFSDQETQELFTQVHWFMDRSPDAKPVPRDLIHNFEVEDAIAYLQEKTDEQILADIQDGVIDIAEFYVWLEGHQQQISYNQSIIQDLRDLPIWPAGDSYTTLEVLYLAGGFEDPFHLASFVDIAALGGRQEFLQHVLQVKPLDFITYVKDFVPEVLAGEASNKSKRALVSLLAARLGEIRDNEEIRRLLSSTTIVDCSDGIFRTASEVYFPSEIISVLGNDVHIAKLSADDKESVRALYAWLGVTDNPRLQDILERVKFLVAKPPTKHTVEAIEKVFTYLANQWVIWDETQHAYFEELRQIRWLPGTSGPEHWHSPGALFPIFRDYLFASEGNFLAFSRPTQNQSSDLRKFLGMDRKIPPIYVVRQLLHCSQHNERVNKEVYDFLNTEVDVEDPALGNLEGRACLLLPNDDEIRYVRPDQVFWGEHPFGRFRFSLDPEFRQFDALFRRLGVRENQPIVEDYLQVLLDISKEYGTSNLYLEEDAYSVVMTCWQFLGRACENEELTAADLRAGIKGHKVIPDPRKILALPERLFFEDRAGLAKKFYKLLLNDIIPRSEGAWYAMELAGVKPLSQAVTLQLTSAPDQAQDEFTENRIQERKILIQRIIDSQKTSGVDGLREDILEQLEYIQVSELEIRLTVHAFNRVLSIDPEPAYAAFKDQSLYTVHRDGQVNWAAMGRELAYAIQPSGEVGSLAMGIKEVLANETFEGASISLDELGYPPLHQVDKIEVPEGERIGALGGDDLVGDPLDAILGGQGPDVPDMPERPPEGSGTGGGGTGTGGTRPPRSRKKKSRLISYVYPEDAVIDVNEPIQDTKRRTKVEKAGIQKVIQYEIMHLRTVKDKNVEQPNHPGYDLESVDEAGNKRLIEVKALSGYWESSNPAMMTRTEYKTARKHGDLFWLYIVERATAEDEEDTVIYCIQNPANRAHYYLYDDGWEPLAVKSK